jgi:Spy/CpxP family protein refolding chaperone
MKSTRMTWIAALLTLALALPTMGQGGAGAGGGDRGGQGGGRRGRGGRGGWDPARMEQMMLGRLKEAIKAPEAEWTAIEPLVKDVLKKRAEGMMRGMRSWGRRRGGDDQQQEPVTPTSELRGLLEKDDSSAEAVKAKLDALRAERTQKESELKASRENLRQVLTVKQEAQLVLMGILD